MNRTFTQSAPVDINAGAPARKRSVISIAEMSGRVRSVRCSVALEHQCLADLRLRLLAPDGREVVLASRRWGNVPGRLDITFSDDAHHVAGSTTTGSVRPDWDLRGLAGVSPNGDWTLVVEDLMRGDGGRVDQWSLSLDTRSASFDIELEYHNLDDRYRGAFQAAKQRWESAIVGDLPSVTVAGRVVDDVLIYASSEHIDGAGGILGQAGPNYIRQSGLPVTGVMRFDAHDLEAMLADGSLTSVIVHEMGHVLGIGTLWHRMVHGINTEDPVFLGPTAMREYGVLLGRGPTPVPVENTGGPGTRGGHWRESVFNAELMTGWIDRGANPLSRVTLGALADLGYAVDMHAAEEFHFLTGFRRPTVGERHNCCVQLPTRVEVIT